MLNDMIAKVERFQREIIGFPIPDSPAALAPERRLARADHLKEEIEEFLTSDDLGDQADGMIDLIYVALGALVEMGVLPGPLFDEVHEANMKKRRGTVAKRANHGGYDAVKPEGWTPPDFTPYLTITKREALALVQARPIVCGGGADGSGE